MEYNELNSEIAVEILNEYGFLVDTAKNGTEAVEKVKNSKPGNYDLVLMDVQMPVMNGYEATKQIRALEDPARAKAYARLIQNGKLAFQLRDRHAAARIKPHLSKNRRSYFRCGEISLTQKLKAIAAEVLIRFT